MRLDFLFYRLFFFLFGDGGKSRYGMEFRGLGWKKKFFLEMVVLIISFGCERGRFFFKWRLKSF